MSSLAIAAIALLAIGAASADEIVSLPTRGQILQPFLLLEPERPARGVVIMLPGHDGEVEFRREQGGEYRVETHGGGLTAHRAMRQALLKRGFAVALLAPPSDRPRIDSAFRRTDEHLRDLREVAGHLQKRYGMKPYVHGHCLGSLSAAALASAATGEGIAGLIMSSTRSTGREGSVTEFASGAVNMPVLLVHHQDDSCPGSPYEEIGRLKVFYQGSSPRVDVITVSGGESMVKKKQHSCQDGFHGFRGAQRETARAIAQWLAGEPFPRRVDGATR